MTNSGIGGQAVIEGIMMRNKSNYSVGVRKPDGAIAVEIYPYENFIHAPGLAKIPLIRGVVAFVDSLVIGLKCLMISAEYFAEEEDEETKKKQAEMSADELAEKKKKEKKQEDLLMTGTLIVSLAAAIAIFMMLPYFVSDFASKYIHSKWLVSLFEAVFRVVIFLIYLLLISRMKDIQRTFMYHGAEHKCINCIENGLELNVENVMKSSRFHKRCGTSFLVYVILISAVLLMFVQAESHIMRIVLRLLLVPVIAGIAYEFIRLAGCSENRFVNALSKPGLAMQKLTTKEPDETMAEVAIAAVEAVFDWKTFIGENFANA